MMQIPQHIPAAMMKGKTMMIASCIGACALGAEAIMLPHAMDHSFGRYQMAHPPIVYMQKADDVVTPTTKVRKHRKSNDGDANKAPVS